MNDDFSDQPITSKIDSVFELSSFDSAPDFTQIDEMCEDGSCAMTSEPSAEEIQNLDERHAQIDAQKSAHETAAQEDRLASEQPEVSPIEKDFLTLFNQTKAWLSEQKQTITEERLKETEEQESFLDGAAIKSQVIGFDVIAAISEVKIYIRATSREKSERGICLDMELFDNQEKRVLLRKNICLDYSITSSLPTALAVIKAMCSGNAKQQFWISKTDARIEEGLKHIVAGQALGLAQITGVGAAHASEQTQEKSAPIQQVSSEVKQEKKNPVQIILNDIQNGKIKSSTHMERDITVGDDGDVASIGIGFSSSQSSAQMVQRAELAKQLHASHLPAGIKVKSWKQGSKFCAVAVHTFTAQTQAEEVAAQMK